MRLSDDSQVTNLHMKSFDGSNLILKTHQIVDSRNEIVNFFIFNADVNQHRSIIRFFLLFLYGIVSFVCFNNFFPCSFIWIFFF